LLESDAAYTGGKGIKLYLTKEGISKNFGIYLKISTPSKNNNNTGIMTFENESGQKL
jgi:hypothetical protein